MIFFSHPFLCLFLFHSFLSFTQITETETGYRIIFSHVQENNTERKERERKAHRESNGRKLVRERERGEGENVRVRKKVRVGVCVRERGGGRK